MSVSGPLDSFGAILSGLAKRLGLETRLVELRIQQRWPEIVGSVIEEGGDGLADASDVIKTSVVSEMGWPSFLSMSLVVPAPVGRRGIP